MVHGVKDTLALILLPNPEGFKVAFVGPVICPHQLLVALTVPVPVLLIPKEVLPERQEFEIIGEPTATSAPAVPFLSNLPFVKIGFPFSI